MNYSCIDDARGAVLTPSGTATAAVIWLHGLGADGHDFVPLVPELGLPDALAVRFVFPHAPIRPVTINNGISMRAWYDIVALSPRGSEDGSGIRASAKVIDGYVREAVAEGIPTGRIVLAGFSQGGAIALHAALRYPERLAGVLALSTYVPQRDSLATEASAANRTTPILMCHGRYDTMLPIELGLASRDLLVSMGYEVQWREYPMQHEVCREEIEQISAWLRARLTPPEMPPGPVTAHGR